MKLEIRNTKSEITNGPKGSRFGNFGIRILKLFRISIFDIRAWILALAGFLALPAHAQLNLGVDNFGAQTALGTGGSGGLIGIISNIINIGLGFLGILTVLYLLYGGFTWMTSGGEAEKVKKAKNIIVRAVIGLVIVLSSWAITLFVLGAIGGATGANVAGIDNGGGGGGGGGGFNGPGPDAFTVRGIAPTGNNANQRITVSIVTNKNINPATAQGNVRIASIDSTGTVGAEIPGTINVSNATIEFTPAGVCPDPNGTLNCFDPDADYQVVVTTAVKSADDKNLNCSPLAPACIATFHAGHIVDTTAPIGALTGPIDGLNFNAATGFTFQSQVTDDVALAKVDYVVDGVLAVSDAAGATLQQWTSSAAWRPTDATLGKVYRLSGDVFDTSGTSADLSGTVSVVARPNHCFNGMKDATETDVDCGGTPADQACGACLGGACTVNTDCASGTCVGGICTAQPVITNVNATDGAPGNMITITGQNFSSNGTVTFLGAAGTDDDVTALLGCTGAWTPTQIIVSVPLTAVTGPIKIQTAGGLSDATNDTRGPVFTFTVNTTSRPGLCSMSPWTAATGDAVTLRGSSLGMAAKLNIGSPAQVSDVVPVDEKEISFTVPALPDAVYPVTVTVGTETSNTLNFRVFTPPPPDPPFIESVTPATGPIGQYVTIKGSNFGNAGKVFFRLKTGNGPFGVGDVVFPEACGTANWQPNMVVVKVPATNDQATAFATGNYTISIVRGGNALSNLKDFDVAAGTPSPGVCRMDPTAGPVGTPVAFYGDAFGTTKGTVAFTGASDLNPTEWAMGQLLSVVPGKQTVPASTPAPVKATSGIVHVKSAANAESNPLFFTVGNCKETVGMCSAMEQCCDNGSCSATCSISLPVQTYAWRFSTGKIPQIPKLLTQCDTQAGLVIPSPAPLAVRAGGNQVCSNALVTAEFDQPLDPTTISGAVKVWQCADEACALPALTAVAGGFGPSVADGFVFTPSAEWTAGKTYLVEVKTSLKSLPMAPALGGNAVVDHGCDRGSVVDNAYCWKFTAGAAICAVKSLATAPQDATASEPYVASAPTTIKDFTAIPGTDPGTCLSITPPPGTVWTWSTSDATLASMLSFVAGLGHVAPHKETGSAPVLIQPHVQAPGGPLVDGEAQLQIVFARPQVVSFEPNCDGACSNATILAKFNTGMIPSSVDMQFMLCSDSNCLPEQRVGSLVTGMVVTSGDGSAALGYKTFSVSPTTLQRSSYYRVLIPAQSGSGSNCKACSMSGMSLAEQGTNFEIGTQKYFSWIFRVRNNASPCTVASVDVEPKNGAVELTGPDIVKYMATPRANPDSCSATGQALNAWGMSWAWSIGSSGIAGTFVNGTNASDASVISSGGSGAGTYVSGIAPGYTSQCVKRGSDAVFGVTAKCGNGSWEKQLGEACDDGNVLPNDGCSARCLTEAFADHNNWTLRGVDGNCGDGRIQRDPVTGVGEECDDGATGSAQCTATCKDIGLAGTGIPPRAYICGNGSIEPYEGCDDANVISGDGCSATCIAEGSASSIVMCGDGTISGTEECDDIPANVGMWDACNHQTCLWKGNVTATCGNNVVNMGEQCDDNNTTSGDGCSAACVLEGSSDAYAMPSFCGDGVVGKGEAAGSEANITRNLTDPVQYVKRLATILSPYRTEVRATAMTVQGKGLFTVNTPGTQCVIPLSPSCTEAACTPLHGTCQTTVAGSECVVTNAPTCAQCAALGGSCVPVVPQLLVQCGVSPAAVPSPAPFVVNAAMPGALATPQANACKNTIVSGQFNIPMNVISGNAASVQSNLAMYDCGAAATLGGDCMTGATAIAGLSSLITMSDANAAFHITPTVAAPWQSGRVYMVGIKGTVQSADGGAPDTTQGIFSPDAAKCKARFGNDVYACWQFKVGTTDCGPASVTVGAFTMSPTNPVGTLPNYLTALNQHGTTSATAIASSCTEIGPLAFAWTRTSTSGTDPNVDFDPATPTSRNAVVKALANGTSTVSATTSGISGNRSVTVQIAPTTCPAGQGPDHSTPPVCKPRPSFTTIPANMDGAAALDTNNLGIARNAAIKVTFDQPIDPATLSAPNAINITYEGPCIASAGPAHFAWMDRMMESFHNTFGILAAEASHLANPNTISDWCSNTLALAAVTAPETNPSIVLDAANKPTLTFRPAAMLKPLKWYRIKISKLISSTDGVTVADATASDPVSYFHTSSKIAPVVGVQVNDSDATRPGYFLDPTQPSRPFTAEAMGQTTQAGAVFPLFPVEGVYAWTWGTGAHPTGWSPSSESAGAVATIAATAKQTTTIVASPSIATVTITKPTEFSDTGIIATTAKISAQSLPITEYFDIPGRAVALNDERTGIIGITVFPCKHPWPSNVSNFPWTDTAAGTPTNFSMFYCRDSDTAKILPDLREQSVPTMGSGALKEYLFINAGQTSKADLPSRMATLAIGGTGAPDLQYMNSRGSPGDYVWAYGTSPSMDLKLELAGPTTMTLTKYWDYDYNWITNGYYAYYQLPTNMQNGSYTATWMTQGGTRSAAYPTPFLVSPRPAVTGFTPETLSVGDTLVVNGENFTTYPYIYVYFYDWAGSWGYALGQFIDDSHIRVVVPSLASGSYSVAVGADWWTNYSTARLNISAGPPRVTGTIPASGLPGTQISITGSGFTSNENLVTFSDGTSVNAVGGIFGGSSISATIPANMQERSYTYVVSNVNGSSTNTAAGTPDPATFRVSSTSPELPFIDSVSPAFGPAETEIILSGQNLYGDSPGNPTKVYLTGSTVIPVDSAQMTTGPNPHPRVRLGPENPPRLHVTIPPVVPKGTYKFRVVNANGVSALSSGSFQMTDPQIPEAPSLVESQTGDVIGVRVVSNPLHLNALDWYQSKGYTGTPKPEVIDGYDAVIDDRTMYIAAANLVQPNVYTNIYIISVNVGARADVAGIFDQLKKTLRFNHNLRRNIDNVNLCRTATAITAPLLTDAGQVIPCEMDSTCAVLSPTAVCASAKAKLIRDVKRVGDFRAVSDGVGATYQQTSVVPAMSSGSFLRSFTTSKWPSWKKEFAESIGAKADMPVDPLNRFTACRTVCSNNPNQSCNAAIVGVCGAGNSCIAETGYEAETCWNETKQVFTCAAGSRLYTYRGMGSARALMGMVFETPNFTGAIGRIGVCEKDSPNAGEACDITSALHKECRIKPNATDPTSAASFYNCVDAFSASATSAPLGLDQAGTCNGTPIGATARCGDGVVSSPEVCEIGEVGIPRACTVSSRNGFQSQACNATCDQWTLGQCVATSCGDGVVNTNNGETCDDGTNNGKYGYCSLQCSRTGTHSCGDMHVDPGEECDDGTTNGVYTANPTTQSGLGCSSQCRKGGPRCGDAVKQPQETCEVGEKQTDANACVTTPDAQHPCDDPSTHRRWIKTKTCASACNGWSEAWALQGSCGDGTKDAGELCDDGNTKNEDTCTNKCELNTCGDGVLNTGIEECDDADRNGQTCDAPYGGVCNYCTSICKVRTVSGGICGNNKAESNEKCDGNDYGGKVCVGGDLANSLCASDSDCGTGGTCSAKFCLNGLKCTAYNDNMPSNPSHTPLIGPVLSTWLATTLDFTNIDPGGQGDHYSIRCEGFLMPRYSETYTLKMTNDDNARLFLNNAKVIDAWVAQDASGFSTASIALTAGKRYPFRIEHIEWGGGERLLLSWRSTSQAEQTIPASAFSYGSDLVNGCTIGTTLNTDITQGICLGGKASNGSTTDGNACSKNSECNGNGGTKGICSFVAGVCSAGSHKGCANAPGKFCAVGSDCGAGIACVSVSDIGASCKDDIACNTNGKCARGICNGGRDNAKNCSRNSDCSDNAQCVFAKCNLTCSAFCPTEFQPISLSFKTINQTSKCVAGHRSNVGGLCSQDTNCVQSSCSPNSPDCVGGTKCVSNVCVFDSDANHPGEYKDGSNAWKSCPGYIGPDGKCAMCAPANTPSATVSLGNYPFDPSVSCGSSGPNAAKCIGGVYGANHEYITRSCTIGKNYECWDIPDRAWLDIPQCSVMRNIKMSVDTSSEQKGPLWVVIITDVTASMQGSYSGSEGSGTLPFSCDGDGTVDSRIKCAYLNLFGINDADTNAALNRLTEYDPSLARVALVNFGISNALLTKSNQTSAAAASLTTPSDQFVRITDVANDAEVYLQGGSTGSGFNQYFLNRSQIAAAKSANRAKYAAIGDFPGSCAEGSLKTAQKLLEGKPGKKVVIILTDACDGNGGREAVLANANQLKKDGVEVYTVSYGLPEQAWQLQELSSNCPRDVVFGSSKTNPCPDNGYFGQVSATNDVKTLFKKINDSIPNISVSAGYGAGLLSGSVSSGFDQVIGSQNILCSPTGHSYLPFIGRSVGVGKAAFSNVSAEYCPVQ